MASKEYLEKLKDPRWQKKRLEILERDGWRCRMCKNDKMMLQVHHLYYLDGKDPWEISNTGLHTLCSDCHAMSHDDKKECWQQLQVALGSRGHDHQLLWDLGMALCTTGGKDDFLTAEEMEGIGHIFQVVLQLRDFGMPIADVISILHQHHADRKSGTTPNA